MAPYSSDSQRRYFHAAMKRGEMKPSTVHEFDEASKGASLPEHVKKLADGGMVCAHCGGMVDDDGASSGHLGDYGDADDFLNPHGRKWG